MSELRDSEHEHEIEVQLDPGNALSRRISPDSRRILPPIPDVNCLIVEQLGDVIGRRCRELGLSQTALAERVGVHVRQIRRYERGEQQPVLGVAVRLAATLGVSLDELAGRRRAAARARRRLVGGAADAARRARRRRRAPARAHAERRDRSPRRVAGRDAGGASCGCRAGRRSPAGTPGDATGTMFFVLREAEDDLIGEGRWVGLGAGGAIVTGHAALARTREAAQTVIAAAERVDRPHKPGSKNPANCRQMWQVHSSAGDPVTRKARIAVSSFDSSSLRPARPQARRLARVRRRRSRHRRRLGDRLRFHLRRQRQRPTRRPPSRRATPAVATSSLSGTVTDATPLSFDWAGRWGSIAADTLMFTVDLSDEVRRPRPTTSRCCWPTRRS